MFYIKNNKIIEFEVLGTDDVFYKYIQAHNCKIDDVNPFIQIQYRNGNKLKTSTINIKHYKIYNTIEELLKNSIVYLNI